MGDDTIDLHGQFVEEAEDILEERIRHARAAGQSHLHVIVGKGNHSTGHVQKIKPRVEQLCRELGLDYATEENEGRIYVNLQGGKVEGRPPPLSTQPQGHQGGYGGGGGYQQQHGDGYQQRPPQQQQHHQQQQQQQHQRPPQRPPQQEQQQEDDIFGCLKACCLVM